MASTQQTGNSKNKNGTLPRDTSDIDPDAKGKIDAKQVRQLLLKVFEFKASIEAKEEELKQEAKGASDLLKAVLEATGGHSGPYELDGKQYIIMSRTSEVKVDGEVQLTDEIDKRGKPTGKKVPATYVHYYLRSPASPPQVVRL